MNTRLIALFLFFSIFSNSQSSIFFDANEKDFASVPNNTFSSFLDGDFSIETVFKIESPTKEKQVLLEYYNKKTNNGFSLYISKHNDLTFLLGNDLFVVEEYLLLPRKCYQVSITVKNSNQIKIFLNGEKVFDKEMKLYSQELPKETILYIGGLPENYFFNGEIDEIRFYKRAITQAQINEYLFSFYEDLIINLEAYYNFDEVTDQVVVDSSLNENNGWLASDETSTIQDPKYTESECIPRTGILKTEVEYCGRLTFNSQPYIECPEPTHFIGGIHIEDFLFFDRFGNIYCNETVDNNTQNSSSKTSSLVANTQTVGNFVLCYDTNFTQQEITIINQAFADFDAFLQFNNNPCGPNGTVNIQIQ